MENRDYIHREIEQMFGENAENDGPERYQRDTEEIIENEYDPNPDDDHDRWW
jgi:hypothetical protein